MRDEYDFSKGVKNPYAKKLKKQITIRVDEDAIDYFKTLSEELARIFHKLPRISRTTTWMWEVGRRRMPKPRTLSLKPGGRSFIVHN